MIEPLRDSAGPTRRLPAALFLAAVLGCHPPVSSGPGTADVEDEMLTVEQTMGLALARFEHGPTLHYFARANPEARGPIRRILANPDLNHYHSVAWLVLGYIGDEKDQARLKESLETQFRGVLSHDDRDSVWAMINALGRMCRRGVGGSCEVLVRWQDPSYWRNVPFRLNEPDIPSMKPFEYEMVADALRSYALAEPPDLDARVRAVLDRIDDPRLKQEMAATIDPERLRAAARRYRRDEARRLTGADLVNLASHFNGDLDDPRPRRGPGAEVGPPIEE